MNRDNHVPVELNDFETRLKSLAPRPPLAAAALVEVPDDLKQVAEGRRWWSVEAETPYAFYRTVGLSASVGALVGGACTLLILSWMAVPTPHLTPPVAVATDEIATDEILPSHVFSNQVSPSNAATATELNQDAAATSGNSSSLAHIEPQPQINSVRRNMSVEYPGDWLDVLRRLQPGTLGVGTRLMNQQSARLRSAKKESTFEPLELSGDESPEANPEFSTGGSRIGLDSPLLPQRQWMRQMLTSPSEFY